MIINIMNKYQFRIYFSMLAKRVGVCSQLVDNPEKHILLCDFDYSPINDIVKSMGEAQEKYNLPTIYIIKTSPDSYHAYSFASRSFKEIIHILASIPEIDMTYLRLGIVRGYFTLRITPRPKEPDFELIKVLNFGFVDEINPLNVTTNEYYTSNLGDKH